MGDALQLAHDLALDRERSSGQDAPGIVLVVGVGALLNGLAAGVGIDHPPAPAAHLQAAPAAPYSNSILVTCNKV
jgi:hypothetical protein